MKTVRILNLFSLLASITVNVLANALPINNITTGELSDQYPVLFTPAGYVFAIWGLIYVSLLAFGLFQVLPNQRENTHLDKIGPWFVLANIFNGGWIFAWHYELVPLSMALMIGLLISLLAIYHRLNIGRENPGQIIQTFVHFPFSIYLGWISVATIANASVLLYTLDWNGWGLTPEVWTILVLAVGTVLGILMIRLRNEIAYPLVLVWAFAGILFKPQSMPPVSTAAGAAALGLLLFLMITLLRARQQSLVEARKDRAKF